jgi:hypothetical protein
MTMRWARVIDFCVGALPAFPEFPIVIASVGMGQRACNIQRIAPCNAFDAMRFEVSELASACVTVPDLRGCILPNCGKQRQEEGGGERSKSAQVSHIQ